MDFRQRIFAIMGATDYVPMRRSELQQALRIKGNEQGEFEELLDELERGGELARLKKDRLCIAEDADLIAGKILFRQSGTATIIPDADPKRPVVDGYPVRSEDTGTALHGDRVLARIVDERQPVRRGKGGRRAAPPSPSGLPNLRVIRILQRGSDTIVGTLEKGKHYAYVIPDDPRIIQDVLVPPPANSGLRPLPKPGDKVVVRLLEWKNRHVSPSGEILEVLGKTHEPDAEFRAILHKYKLDPQFPPACEKELESLPDAVRQKDIGNRLDLRDRFIFTIDPDDAKDFDDALSYEPLKDGRVRIGVHIADVSAYVRPGTELDKEAQERGNSTYLVGTVIPMLPHKLSNGLCSLVEAEDRLTKTVFLTIDKKGGIEETQFANSIICSVKRLTYRQAYAFLMEDDLAKVAATPLPPSHQTGATGMALADVPEATMLQLQESIRGLWRIAEKLRRERFRKGSLDLDMTDVKIYVDEDGYADRLEVQHNDESHQLIEEFMLAANEAVARTMRTNNFPCIYRVHEEPDPEKLKELRETMQIAGVPCGNLEKTDAMAALLRELKDHPQGHSLRISVLRSLKQANYRANPDGHYGLAKPDYTHFTSPIRRYSDLIVHRVMEAYMHRHSIETAPEHVAIHYKQGKLEALGDHLSITERNSVDAERDSVKTKLLEFFERELNKPQRTTFDAVITEIKNHGMFIELPDAGAFGLIHISTLTDDFYIVGDDGTSLVGRRHRREYRLGETISVEVERVDRFKRQIDFRVAGGKEMASSPSPKKSRRKGGRPADASTTEKGGTPNGRRRRSKLVRVRDDGESKAGDQTQPKPSGGGSPSATPKAKPKAGGRNRRRPATGGGGGDPSAKPKADSSRPKKAASSAKPAAAGRRSGRGSRPGKSSS